MRDLANPSGLNSLNFSFKYCDTLNWSALERMSVMFFSFQEKWYSVELTIKLTVACDDVLWVASMTQRFHVVSTKRLSWQALWASRSESHSLTEEDLSNFGKRTYFVIFRNNVPREALSVWTWFTEKAFVLKEKISKQFFNSVHALLFSAMNNKHVEGLVERDKIARVFSRAKCPVLI